MSRHVVELVRCDVCGAEANEELPVVTKTYGWMNREWEIDLCPTHTDEVEEIFEKLTADSRRTDSTPARAPRTSRPTSSVRTRRRPMQGVFDVYKNQDGLYECPWFDDKGRSCPREFEQANGLAVHSTRTHDIKLTGDLEADKEAIQAYHKATAPAPSDSGAVEREPQLVSS